MRDFRIFLTPPLSFVSSTIITAIRKGRGIFFNLQKFMLYLLSGNLAEVLVMMVGLSFIDQNGESTFPIAPGEW